jgi:hypothetical protein
MQTSILKLVHIHNELHVDRDSSVGIATRYRLDGPGIEYRWWRDFPHPPSLQCNGYRVFPGGKAAEAWR